MAVKYRQNEQWNSTTYRKLKREAQSISAWLAHLGVGVGDAVILPSRRTPNLCAQLLGIQWSGAHYVFIDDEYPLQRQQLICTEAGARIGIYDGSQPDSTELPITWHRIPVSLPEPDYHSAGQDPELPA